MSEHRPLRCPTEAEVGDFHGDGFVLLRAVLPPEWLEPLGPACERLMQAPDALDITEETVRRRLPTDAGLFGAPDYAASLAGRARFRMHFNTARREPAVEAFALSGALGALAAGLMRSNTVRFVDDILFVKDPGARELTEWHDDDLGSVTTGPQRCSVWVSLADVPGEAGPLLFLRGSHRRFRGWREAGLQAGALAQANASEIVACPLQAGDVVVHQLETIHGAGANLSPGPRRAWALRYAGEQARFILRDTRYEPRSWYGIEDGEPLAGPMFPVAWPAAAASRMAEHQADGAPL